MRLGLRRLARQRGLSDSEAPHLAFFLHDEVIVHTPLEHAEAVALAVSHSAAATGPVLFGETPVEFPLDVRVAPRASKE